MEFRLWQHRLMLLAVCGIMSLAAVPAWAEDCAVVTDAGPSIDKFLDEAQAAQAAGAGTMPINDVLFGVTGISAEDQQRLDKRDLVEMTRRDVAGGDYESRGPKRVTIEGIFAGRDTLFRIPKLVMGKYTLSDTGAILVYDPEHPVEVGESVVGIHFFKSVHRTVIARDRLEFFFAGNESAEPDRCYVVKR